MIPPDKSYTYDLKSKDAELKSLKMSVVTWDEFKGIKDASAKFGQEYDEIKKIVNDLLQGKNSIGATQFSISPTISGFYDYLEDLLNQKLWMENPQRSPNWPIGGIRLI